MSSDPADALLPHLDRQRILSVYAAAPGGEIDSGKFSNPASSAALAANAFGFFLDQPRLLETNSLSAASGRAKSVTLESIVRFQWAGGRHPCLDALIETDGQILGIESKRYEPFRSKPKPSFSAAFDRDVWTGLQGWNKTRCELQSGEAVLRHLDGTQLVKHALGLAAEARRRGLVAKLVYLYAEPSAWPDGRDVGARSHAAHREEVEWLCAQVTDDAVALIALDYKTLLTRWRNEGGQVGEHAGAMLAAFDI